MGSTLFSKNTLLLVTILCACKLFYTNRLCHIRNAYRLFKYCFSRCWSFCSLCGKCLEKSCKGTSSSCTLCSLWDLDSELQILSCNCSFLSWALYLKRVIVRHPVYLIGSKQWQKSDRRQSGHRLGIWSLFLRVRKL